MPKPIRIGVVGAGLIASSVHLPILRRRIDLFDLRAITDLNRAAADALAKRFAINKVFDSTAAMYESGEIDAVFILNSGGHAEVAAQALDAGLDVFCEKPLAYSQDEMVLIETAWRKSGRKLMLGYMKTFDQAVYKAQERIKSRPRSVDVVVFHPSGDSQVATTDAHLETFPLSKESLAKIEESNKKAMVDAICAEIKLQNTYLPVKNLETIYFGGGTPSLLHPAELAKILTHIHREFSVNHQAEITLEANQEDLTVEYLEAIRALGINRLSIGIQSFKEKNLPFLHRNHSVSDSLLCIARAQEVGLSNISIDLIYGIPENTMSDLEKDLDTAIQTGVEHISAYSLTIEPKTVFGQQKKKGILSKNIS